jgi:hypothetical protein
MGLRREMSFNDDVTGKVSYTPILKVIRLVVFMQSGELFLMPFVTIRQR